MLEFSLDAAILAASTYNVGVQCFNVSNAQSYFKKETTTLVENLAG